MTRIHLISGPRNLSTALMYSFGNRADCSIVDEPFYAWYLNQTDIDHPGREQVLATMDQDVDRVKQNVLFAPYETPVVFFKNMAHHIINTDLGFLDDLTNLFLIRDTTQLIRSFQKVIPNPIMRDIGVQREWELYEYLKNKGKNPLVLDSGQLLKDPEGVLRRLCEGLNIPFDPNMLSWPAGARKEDGIWAEWWYKGVHQSTCFEQRETSRSIEPLPESLMELDEKARYYYDKLSAEAV
ncbi:sulfotransferase family protein [bacterium SCSIO 12741]|nr:sulfotransferase family protein [bacterium SCSIO 12741]